MTMSLLVERLWPTSQAVCGRLTAGDLHFFTLEPPYGSPDVKPRAIPAGTYDLQILWSPKHRRIVPHVMNVPGFEEIEIHWGNYPKDTEGCLLVGNTHLTDFIGDSLKAFDALFTLLAEWNNGGGGITITYMDSVAEGQVAPDVSQ